MKDHREIQILIEWCILAVETLLPSRQKNDLTRTPIRIKQASKQALVLAKTNLIAISSRRHTLILESETDSGRSFTLHERAIEHISPATKQKRILLRTCGIERKASSGSLVENFSRGLVTS